MNLIKLLSLSSALLYNVAFVALADTPGTTNGTIGNGGELTNYIKNQIK